MDCAFACFFVWILSLDFHEVRILESLTNQHFCRLHAMDFFCSTKAWKIWTPGRWEITIPSHPIKSGGVFFSKVLITQNPKNCFKTLPFFFSCVIEVIILIVLKPEFNVYRVFLSKKHGIFFRDVFLSSHLPISNWGVRQLSVSCCGLRNQQYLRQRKQLLWGDGGPWCHHILGVRRMLDTCWMMYFFFCKFQRYSSCTRWALTISIGL